MIDVAAPAQRLLAAIAAHYADHDWDLPSRRYLAAGQQQVLAADGEHVCVTMGALHRGSTGGRSQGVGTSGKGAGAAPLPRVELILRIMRCVATIDDDGVPPTAAQITADALRVLEDPAQLVDALYAWAASEPPHLTVDFGPIEPIGPEGGLVGHFVPVVIAPVQ